MNRYLYIICMWLCSLSVMAQTDGYNPTNPPLPDLPTDDPKVTTYTLVVNSSPNGSGSLNTSGGQYEEGATIYLYAYNHDGFNFMYWIDDEGNTISTSNGFYYTMPKRDAVVTAVYKYSPSNPSLPDAPEQPVTTYNLKLDTKPAGAGSFNTGNIDLAEDASIHLYAYTNSNFYFKHWEDAEGNVISTAQSFYYTMPAKDTQLYAIYTYNPSNPANPGRNFYDSFTGEVIIDDFERGNLTWAIDEVTKGNTSNITSITVAGVINSYDFSIANNYSACTIVDLSRTSGASTVPAYCYYGNTNLNRLSLPASISYIEYYAFYNATGLTELTCYAPVPPTLEWAVFDGVTPGLIVYVPAKSVELYEKAERWKDYVDNGTIVIMPVQNQVSSLEINLPEECADGRYKNMPLELLNVKSGQKYKYVVTDRINYTFNNLVHGTRYVASLKNLSGAVLAKTDTISIAEENVSVTFDIDMMKQLRAVKAAVLTSEGTDVTSECTINWYDANGMFLVQGTSLANQVSETIVKCVVTLPQALAMEYVLPEEMTYEVLEGENNLVCTLAKLPSTQIAGRIVDVATELPIADATITVSQTLNGRYSKSFSAKTDKTGAYSMTVFAAPSSLTFAASDYVSQTTEMEGAAFTAETTVIDDVKLKPISGATIATNFTYTPSVAVTVEPEVQNYYSGYNNVAYNIYNVTAQKEIKDFNVQYPNIVLLEEVNTGDSLSIKVTSKNGAFMDITTGGRISETLRMDVNVPVIQLGGIDATFTTTENSKVLGILYDSKGTFVSKYNYGSANLSIRELRDGEYTLVTMGASDFFGSIYNIEKFAEAGLKQNIDYLVNKVTVKSGVIAPLKNVLVPFFDESKFYYTGENTSFTVNKTSIVAGNYLTLTAKVDFKEVYKSSISDVKFTLELPEGTSLVDNSVMVGSNVAFYEVNGRNVTIPLDNNDSSDRIRLCVIPTVSGSFSPSATIDFTLGEKNISQPLGNIVYNVKNLAINVPEQTASTEISITGVATGGSEVTVYADEDVIGTTKALANGYWTLDTELPQPYNLQDFNIYAKVVTKQGLELQTSTEKCRYNKDYVIAKTVEMSFYNGWLHKNVSVVFDLEHARVSDNSYMFYTGTDITFAVDLSDNDPEKVNGVMVNVYTDKQEWHKIPATYNARINKWVAVRRFESNNLPIGLTVNIDALTPAYVDADIVSGSLQNLQNFIDGLRDGQEEFNGMVDNLSAILGNEDCDYDALCAQLQEINDALGITSDFEIIEDLKEEDVQATIAELDALLAGEMIPSLDGILSLDLNDLSSLKEYLNGIQLQTCDGLTDEMLVEMGYERIMKTDSTYLYILASEDKYEMADLSLNLRISFTPESKMYARLKTAGGDGIEKIDYYCNEINKYLNDFMTVIQGVATAVDQVEAKLIAANVKINDLLKTLNKQLSTMASKHAPWYERLALNAKIKSYMLAKSANNKMLAVIAKDFKQLRIGKGASKAFGVFGFIATLKDAIGDFGKLKALHDKITPCPNDESNASKVRAAIIGTGLGAGMYYLSQLTSSVCAIFGINTGIIGAIPTGGVSLSAVAVSVGVIVANCAATIAYGHFFENSVKQLKADAAALRCYGCNCENGQPCTCPKDKCLCPKCQDDDDDPEPYPLINPIHDPSGYVYEGVSSNRLQGVTATAYYKEIVEDMYGDLHENIVLWDAEEYAQQNPLFTDENGMYAWDVPQGLWQVRFEKEGYVPTQSEWLPVPPPQMDVNIGMVQNAQPEVVSARAYEDGVEIEFSKYMDIESLNNENIFVKVVSGTEESLITDAEIQMLNKEVAIEGSTTEYASKVKLATDQLGYYDEAYIIVSTDVNSYAGIPMAQAFEQRLDVEKKVRELLVDAEFNVEYNGQKQIIIAAIPAEAAAGKKITISSASEMIATTDVQEVTLDADGQATFTVNGELYGATALNYALVDADLEATSMINVVDPKKLEEVKAPMASRISGTAVYRGQTVALTCETEGAVIYYTTDGSCPCDEATRIKYERPIAINDAMTLKFMSVGPNFDESDVVECTYSIRQSDVKLNLAEGWNWSSHDVASPIDISELSGIASVVLTQTDEVIDDPVLGFVGTLTSIDASETMKIKAKASTLKAFNGEQYNPALSPINLQSGWNWLGYPINQTMTIADALSYMDAEEGDCISNLDGGFATYTNGSWVGSLEIMTPGAGYLYKSATSKSFIYNDVPTVQNARALYGHRLELKSAPWSVNKHSYPNMMPMIAQVCYADGEAADSTFYVAAFAGNECRGIGKYADGVIYLSVYGDKATELTFKAWNEDTDYVQDFAETITFTPDVVGTSAAPFMLMLGSDPNSINTISHVNGVDGIYNLQGVKVNSVAGSGIYIIKSTDKHGNSVIQKSYVK